jgi:hypothetical protein
MITLLARVLPLAFGAAISPTLFVGVVLLLSSPGRPRTRAAAFGVGAALPLVVIAVVGLIVFRHAIAGGHHRISPVVDVVFGAILLLLAVRIALKPSAANNQQSHPVAAGPAKCILLGLGLMIANFSSLALFIPAVKDVATAVSVGLGGKVVVLVIVMLIVLLTILVPVLLYTLAPDRAQAVLVPLVTKTRNHSHAIGLAVCLIFGIYLAVKGIVAL